MTALKIVAIICLAGVVIGYLVSAAYNRDTHEFESNTGNEDVID